MPTEANTAEGAGTDAPVPAHDSELAKLVTKLEILARIPKPRSIPALGRK